MGCASSKPSSSKTKNKAESSTSASSSHKQKPNSNQQKQPVSSATAATKEQHNELDEKIKVDKRLLEQIKANESQVVDYIVRIVRKELNADLVKHKTNGLTSTPNSHSSPSSSSTNHHNNTNHLSNAANMAAVAVAAASAQENDDLIIDVVSKALNTIELTSNTSPALTYKALNTSLKSWPFICKNQTNKLKICDLTCDTIRNCLNVLNESSHDPAFDLLDFLNGNKKSTEVTQQKHVELPLTPPQTPEQNKSPEQEWSKSAILLSRLEANELARMLFLSNRGRPVVHASPNVKDAYFVNKQMEDRNEVTVTREEIDQILNSTNGAPPPTPPLSRPPGSDMFYNLNMNDDTDLNATIQTLEEAIVVTRGDDSERLLHQADEYEEGANTHDLTAVTNDLSETSDELLKQTTLQTALAGITVLSNNLSLDTSTNTNSNSINLNNNTNTSDHFEDANASLIVTDDPEKGSLDPIVKQALLDDRFYNNDSFKTDPPVNGHNQNEAATKIQANLRGQAIRQGGDHQKGEA